ncbi:putative bacterial surface layer protein [Lactobacillus helveticus DSM 20075 = CGMCC 1.1877]|nr:putative bacterial surface layer protein [Lactobacillus helveticus DSM 20075 = CGMCC 1.1877]
MNGLFPYYLLDTIKGVIQGGNYLMKKRLLTSIAAAVVLTSTIAPASNISAITDLRSQKVSAATDAQTEFLNKAAKEAVKAAKKYGTYPSVMIAQAIIESGWGQSGLAVNSNNLFGMKADDSWSGESYLARTREEKDGKSYYINAIFRKYNSLKESFEDNGKKLREGVSWQPLRYKGAWLENANTYAEATKALTGTYATDSKYDIALNSRITSHNLNQYDPVISKTTKHYTVEKSGSVYNWPTDHSVAKAVGSVKSGEKVTVTKTITFHDGSSRMYIEGKGWINGTSLTKGKTTTSEPSTQAPKGATKVEKNLMHNAYVYDAKGKKIKGKMYKISDEEGSKLIATYGTKTIKKKTYYRVGENEYIAAGNIDGTLRFLKHNTYVYNQYGNRDNTLKRKKNEQVATYGSAVKINGKKYYRIGIRQYIKKSNFM